MPALQRSGLTLIEVVIVVAILAVAFAMVVPALWLVRSAADSRACANNLHQLALACHHSQASFKRLPPALGWFPEVSINGGAGIGPLFFHLLVFIEENGSYQSSHRQSNSPRQSYFDYQQIGDRPIALYGCPADPTLTALGSRSVRPYAGSSYAANYVVFGRVDSQFRSVSGAGRTSLTASFPDGTSNTILFGEKIADIKAGQGASTGGCHWDYWGKPEFTAFFALDVPGRSDPGSVGPLSAKDSRDSRFQVQPAPGKAKPYLCSTAHHGGMNAAMADGSVRTLSAGIDRFTWWALVTPAAGDQPKLAEF